jgi:hypothetical protein
MRKLIRSVIEPATYNHEEAVSQSPAHEGALSNKFASPTPEVHDAELSNAEQDPQQPCPSQDDDSPDASVKATENDSSNYNARLHDLVSQLGMGIPKVKRKCSLPRQRTAKHKRCTNATAMGALSLEEQALYSQLQSLIADFQSA